MTILTSAISAISTSDCPAPTVSRTITSKPAASIRSATRAAEADRPPRCPRDASERMNTPASIVCSAIRIRSPRTAPPVIGLEGSTAATATVRPRPRISPMNAFTSVDFPAPGGPVKPTTIARPRCGWIAFNSALTVGPSRSTMLIARASAAVCPANRRAKSPGFSAV